MRILIVAPEWPPNVIGGGGAVFERIGAYLASAGNDVTAAVGNFRNDNVVAAAARRTVGGVHIVDLPLFPTPARMAWLATALPPVPRAFVEFDRLLRQNWDAAHLHGVGFPMVDYAAWVLRRRKVPYLFTIHGFPVSPLTRGAVAAKAMRWYLNAITKRTLDGAAAVTAVSRAMLEGSPIPISDGKVIYNGVDFEPPDGAALQQHRVSRNPMRLMSMSRLSRNKGLDLAIEAVAELTSNGFPVTYDIFGSDGGDLDALRATVDRLHLRDIVTFRGRFLPGDRAAVLAKYDTCLVPSRVEAFGLVALESQLAGLPVVAAAQEGLKEALSPDSAILVDSSDFKVWARAIVASAETAHRESLIAAGFRNASRFAWKGIQEQYESELRAIGRER